jgi:general secretion pathway protein J
MTRVNGVRCGGFTLVEILVAIAILTVITVMAYAGYNELVLQSEMAKEKMDRVRAVQSAVLKLSQDFAQLEPRPVREPLGVGVQPALRADARLGSLVQLTRAGWANPAGIGRSTLQRVEYRLENDVLLRDQHLSLDSVVEDQPSQVKLLDKVRALRIEFLDVQQQWSSEWPRAGTSSLRARPLAIRFDLELEDWGTITRIVEVSNVTTN